MATPKSPFFIVQNFISPKVCEKVVDSLGIYTTDTDPEGNPIKMYRYKEDQELMLFDRLKPLIPTLMDYYQADYKATETIQFEYFAPGIEPEAHCENSNFVRKKWVRTKDRDFSAVLFFSDYNDNPPFDSEYECYGGKLEFPQHGFGFNPERGTLIVFPSSPHFVNATASLFAGELIQARIHFACKLPYMYDPTMFPGNYTNWFQELN